MDRQRERHMVTDPIEPGESVTDRKIRQSLGYRKLKKPGQCVNDQAI